jgi:mannosyl-oligosaccharide alpha-1,2-mannosidase
MFRAWERWSRVPSGGYAALQDVRRLPPSATGKQQSFWLAETLLYLHLLFEDDEGVLPLDRWVFTTEAHPLPVWGSEAEALAMARSARRRARRRALRASGGQGAAESLVLTSGGND